MTETLVEQLLVYVIAFGPLVGIGALWVWTTMLIKPVQQ